MTRKNKMQILNGSEFFFCFCCSATSALLTMNKNLTSYCWGHKARGLEEPEQTNKPAQSGHVSPFYAHEKRRACASLILPFSRGFGFWALSSGISGVK